MTYETIDQLITTQQLHLYTEHPQQTSQKRFISSLTQSHRVFLQHLYILTILHLTQSPIANDF